MVRSRLIHALVAVSLLVAPLFLFGDRALAIQDSEDKVWFGPIGLAVGEAARINVVGNPDTVGNPNDTPWTFVMRVFDRQGRVVQANRLEVARGAIGSFQIIGNPDERTAISAVAVRQTLRAEIVGFNPQPDPPGQYIATMEVYNVLNGRTSVFIGNPDVVPATRVGTVTQ
jgi:hypothetical protein